jgi:hypothetical protein
MPAARHVEAHPTTKMTLKDLKDLPKEMFEDLCMAAKPAWDRF